jgi:O-antigen/teichoic acid export membrane protein
MKAINLGTQIRQISVVTVLIGFVSYAFNFVIARLLTPDDAARIMTSWTVINLSLLIVQFPLELYAPRLLRSMAERGQHKHFDSLVLLYICGTSVLTFVLFLGYYTARYGNNPTEVSVFAFLIASISLFQMFRTINIARENLARLLQSALVLSLTSFCSYAVVFLRDIHSAKGPLLSAAFGFTAAGFMNIRLTDITLNKINAIFSKRVAYLETFSFKEIGALSLSNLVSLLLVPGGAVFTGVVGLTTAETVIYLGSTALALIPITVLNSTTMPIYLRAINLFSEKNIVQLRVLFIRTAFAYLALSVTIVFLFWLVGERLLLIFIGDKYQYSQMVFTLSSIAVCVAFTGSISRLFLMAMGKTNQTFKPLLLTVVLYLILVFSIRNGFIGLFAASFASALFISATTFLLLQQAIRAWTLKKP